MVKRKEDSLKEFLGASDEDTRERCLDIYREEMRKTKSCAYQSTNEV